MYACFHVYESHRFKKLSSEIFIIFVVNAVGVVSLMAVVYLLKIMDFSRGIFGIYFFVSTELTVIKRIIVACSVKHLRKIGYNQKHVVIVGNGRHAYQYIDDVTNNPQVGVIVGGYVSKYQKNGLGKCLGSYGDLTEILQNHEIDELIVALEPHEVQFMKYVIDCADKEGVRLSLIPFFNEYFPSNVRMEILGNSKLIDMRATPLDSIFSKFVKRAIDIVGSFLGIVLLSPVMIITAVGVKLSSPGPILFKQDRVEINKKPFKMLKFRSMRINDREITGWSTDSDPRKTRFGSIIRKLSIDELPQLFNVLIGDMSLVGPRPEGPHYVRKFKEDVPLYLLRQQIRPGITGWAQVNGLRGDTSIEERVKYDIWYIENWSLWLDIKILFKTAFGGMVNSEKIR